MSGLTLWVPRDERRETQHVVERCRAPGPARAQHGRRAGVRKSWLRDRRLESVGRGKAQEALGPVRVMSRAGSSVP